MGMASISSFYSSHGILIAFYQNQQEIQRRSRLFLLLRLFLLPVWIASHDILFDHHRGVWLNSRTLMPVTAAVLALGCILVPGRMLQR